MNDLEKKKMVENNVKPERRNIKYAKFKTIMATAANDYNTILCNGTIKTKAKKSKRGKKNTGASEDEEKTRQGCQNTFGKHAVSSIWAGVFASIRHITKRKRHEERKKYAKPEKRWEL